MLLEQADKVSDDGPSWSLGTLGTNLWKQLCKIRPNKFRNKGRHSWRDYLIMMTKLRRSCETFWHGLVFHTENICCHCRRLQHKLWWPALFICCADGECTIKTHLSNSHRKKEVILFTAAGYIPVFIQLNSKSYACCCSACFYNGWVIFLNHMLSLLKEWRECNTPPQTLWQLHKIS